MNETIVSMQGICKSFPGVKAAVAALNGENLGGAVTDTGVSVLTK